MIKEISNVELDLNHLSLQINNLLYINNSKSKHLSVASGEFYSHKDTLDSFLLKGKESDVKKDVVLILKHYSVELKELNR